MRWMPWIGVVAMSLMAVGCGPDPEMVKEKEALSAQVQDLTQKLERTERERDALRSRATRLEADMKALRNQEVIRALGLSEGQALSARLDTTQGTLNCELWPEHAPKTVLNFVQLAEGTREWTDPNTGTKVKKPLYNGTVFHRVIPGFMVQGGDPLGNGRGGPGYKFEDEVSSELRFDRPGLLAMANSGPNTNGSQFFVTEGTPSHLNGKHTIFGHCEELDVVKTITGVQRARGDRPVTDVVLRRVVIQRG